MKYLFTLLTISLLSGSLKAEYSCPIDQTVSDNHKNYELQKTWTKTSKDLNEIGFSWEGYSNEGKLYTTNLTQKKHSYPVEVGFYKKKYEKNFFKKCYLEHERAGKREYEFIEDIYSIHKPRIENSDKMNMYLKLNGSKITKEIESTFGEANNFKVSNANVHFVIVNDGPSSFVKNRYFLPLTIEHLNENIKNSKNLDIKLPLISPTIGCDIALGNIKMFISYDVVDTNSSKLVVQEERHSPEYLEEVGKMWSQIEQTENRELNIYRAGLALNEFLAEGNEYIVSDHSFSLLKSLMPSNYIIEPDYQSDKWFCATDRLQAYGNKSNYKDNFEFELNLGGIKNLREKFDVEL